MAVPLSADLFSKYGIARVNVHAPTAQVKEHECCLHGSQCPAEGKTHNDAMNAPSEMMLRVKSHMASKSCSPEEQAVYKTIQMLLATLMVADEMGANSSKKQFNKSIQKLHPQNAPTPEHDLIRSASDNALSVKDETQKQKIYPKIFVHPSSPGRLAWDLISLTIVMTDSIILPFQLSYYDSAPNDWWFWFGTIFFSLDICLNFITGYVAGPLEHDHGQLVKDKVRIARWYLKSWFLIDFASTVPWQFLIPSGGGNGTRAAKAFKIAKLVRFLRLARMLKLLKLQDSWTKIENVVGSMFIVQAMQLLRVLFLVIYVCHWNACIWWIIGNPMALLGDPDTGAVTLEPHWTTRLYHQTFRNNEGEEIIRKFRWIDDDIPTGAKYAFCFYWTLGVMRTMPQEAFPTNTMERLYTLGFMFFAFSMFSICITKITQMFNKINMRRQEFNEHMAHVKTYMHDNDVDNELKDRICGYLEHRFNRRRIFAKELGLFNELSENLRIEIRCAQLGPAIGSVWFFEALQETEIKEIVTICMIQDYGPGDIVTQADTVCEASYILISGRLSTIDPAQIRKMSARELAERLAKEGGNANVLSCDVESLLLDQPTTAEKTVWASDFSEILAIYKVDFMDLRKLNPTIDQHIRMLQNSNRGLAIREKMFSRMSFVGDDMADAMENMTQRRKKGLQGARFSEGADTDGDTAAVMAG